MENSSTTLVLGRFAVDLNHILGSGSYGKVVKGYDTENNFIPVAVKVINKARLSKVASNDLKREAEIMKRLAPHPNIMHLYDCQEDQTNLYLFLEFFETDLLNYVQKRGPLPEATAKSVFKQLADALAHMHKNQITHGDLKLENVLYDPESGRACLIDFGFSKQAIPGENRAVGVSASPGYVAPEILRKDGSGETYDPYPGDVYSLGVVLYSMVYGLFPFLDVVQGKSYYADGVQHPVGNSSLFKNGRFGGPRRPSLTFPETASIPLQRVLHQMLTKDQRIRATIFEIKSHSWLLDVNTDKKPRLGSVVRTLFRQTGTSTARVQA